MPLFLEPDQRFPVVLDSDKDKPEDVRPTFYCKALSGRGMARLADWLDTPREGKVTQMLDEHADELMQHCVGWANIPEQYPFGKESFIEILHYMEMRELLRKIMLNQHVQLEEKKS